MMNKFLKNAFWSLLGFFAIILFIAYYNNRYAGMKKALSDPWNWLAIGIVICASFVYKIYRDRKEAGQTPPNH